MIFFFKKRKKVVFRKTETVKEKKSVLLIKTLNNFKNTCEKCVQTPREDEPEIKKGNTKTYDNIVHLQLKSWFGYIMYSQFSHRKQSMLLG